LKMEYLTDNDYAIAAKNGISRKRVYQRYYENGWDKERSITQNVRQQKIRKSKWFTYHTKCEALEISPGTFYSRLQRGMEPEEAATTPVVKRK